MNTVKSLIAKWQENTYSNSQKETIDEFIADLQSLELSFDEGKLDETAIKYAVEQKKGEVTLGTTHINDFKAGAKWAMEHIQQPEMRWVRADERLPTITQWYVVRNFYTKKAFSLYCDSQNSLIKYCDDNNIELYYLEWLEEHPTSTEHIQPTISTNIKDHYGKEIFDGDVLGRTTIPDRYVFYVDGVFKTKNINNGKVEDIIIDVFDVVIGNRYKNPELIIPISPKEEHIQPTEEKCSCKTIEEVTDCDKKCDFGIKQSHPKDEKVQIAEEIYEIRKDNNLINALPILVREYAEQIISQSK